MGEMRWNPLLGTWVIVASHRQHRPNLEDGDCPFCPSSGRVPPDFEVYAYPNDFPSLTLEAEQPDIEGDHLVPVRPAFGSCEVTLYSPQHQATLPELPLSHIRKLVDHWEQRYRELGSIPGIEYVFIFENRGEAVGVTMIHPHGQIYAYPYIPLKIKTELENARAYLEGEGRCLICDIIKRETAEARRMIYRNEGFSAFIPPFAEYPYMVILAPDRHACSISALEDRERSGLAAAIKCITGGYDDLYGYPFPYMMCMHQEPCDGKEYRYYHYHIEFYPPMRSADKMKYNASSETGAWAIINPTSPEEKAAELKDKVSSRLKALNREREPR